MTPAEAAKVLVLSSENYDQDQRMMQVLTAYGHAPTLGPSFTNFTLTTDLRNYEAVVLQASHNYNRPEMASAGQAYLRNYVQGGGGLVTAGWLSYMGHYSKMLTLATIFPFQSGYSWNVNNPITYTLDPAAADPVLNAGLPETFTFQTQNVGGTEEQWVLKSGAVRYYTSNNTVNIGVAGWAQGQGEVLSFACMAGLASLNDVNFSRLFANAVTKVAGATNPSQLYKGLEAFVAPRVRVAGRTRITTTRASYRVRGSASGTFRVVRVNVQAGRKASVAAGTTAWSANIRLKRGRTVCTFRAVDANGFVSAPATVVIRRK